jgi:hypothetical protein
MVLKLNEGRMEVPANGLKKLNNFTEYDLKWHIKFTDMALS